MVPASEMLESGACLTLFSEVLYTFCLVIKKMPALNHFQTTSLTGKKEHSETERNMTSAPQNRDCLL